MKAIAFAAPIPRFIATKVAGRVSDAWLMGPHSCTRYLDVATPDLPGDDWVRIRTRLGGICGSDLGIVGLDASPSASPFSSFPFVIGHESVGTIDSSDLVCGSRTVECTLAERVGFLLAAQRQAIRWHAKIASGDSRPALAGAREYGDALLTTAAKTWFSL
jgi:hypothetical protein